MEFLFKLIKSIALETESLSFLVCYQPKKIKRK